MYILYNTLVACINYMDSAVPSYTYNDDNNILLIIENNIILYYVPSAEIIIACDTH